MAIAIYRSLSGLRSGDLNLQMSGAIAGYRLFLHRTRAPALVLPICEKSTFIYDFYPLRY